MKRTFDTAIGDAKTPQREIDAARAMAVCKGALAGAFIALCVFYGLAFDMAGGW